MVSDADDGESSAVLASSLAGTYGDFTFNTSSGAWTYTLRNGDPSVQALNSSDTVTDSLHIKSFDGTAADMIVVSIHGSDEASVLPPPPPILGPDPNDFDASGNPVGTLIVGTPLNDTLYGGGGADLIVDPLGGNDTIYGGSGDDGINAGPGDDSVYGGSGNDTLIGGPGNDLLVGGYGNDSLTGGLGADTFKYLSMSDRTDTIADFNKADGDKLDIHDLLSSVGAPHDAGAFSGGFVNFLNAGGDTQVMIDMDGSAGAISSVLLVTLTNTTLAEVDTANYVL